MYLQIKYSPPTPQSCRASLHCCLSVSILSTPVSSDSVLQGGVPGSTLPTHPLDWPSRLFLMRLTNLTRSLTAPCFQSCTSETPGREKLRGPLTPLLTNTVWFTVFTVSSVFLCFIVYFVEGGSQPVQTGPERTRQKIVTLNYWSSCLHLLNAAILGLHYQA